MKMTKLAIAAMAAGSVGWGLAGAQEPAPTVKEETPAPDAKPAEGAAAQAETKPDEIKAPAAKAVEPGADKRPAPAFFRRADTDKDGKISLEDIKKVVPNFPEDRFAGFDGNKDGFLVVDELRNPRSMGSGEDRGRGMLERADEDKDGKITAEEFVKAYPRLGDIRFKALDANKDGTLSPDEAAPNRGAAIAGLIRNADEDKDGKVSKAEFAKAEPKADESRFQSLDQNADGSLSSEDIEGSVRPTGPGVGFAQMRDRLIQENDADKDGKLTQEELQKSKPGFPEATFKRLDGNGDGVVSAEDTTPGRLEGRAIGSRGEAEGGMREAMEKADADKDGKLSQEEALKGIPNMTEDRFKRRDRNADGFLSAEDRAERKPATPAVKPAAPATKPAAPAQETAPAQGTEPASE